MKKRGHTNRGRNSLLMLLSMAAGLCLTLGETLASNTVKPGQNEVDVQMTASAKSSNKAETTEQMHDSSLSDQTGGRLNMGVGGQARHGLGHPPIRALQIPGHVLEAITSNMGTELITLD